MSPTLADTRPIPESMLSKRKGRRTIHWPQRILWSRKRITLFVERWNKPRQRTPLRDKDRSSSNHRDPEG